MPKRQPHALAEGVPNYFTDAERQAIQAALERRSLRPDRLPAWLRRRVSVQLRRHLHAGFPDSALQALAQQDTVVVVRRGKAVYRRPKKAGADLPRPPLDMAIRRRQRQYAAELTKALRHLLLTPPREASAKGVLARQAKAAQRRELVLQLAERYADRGRAKVSIIAKSVDMTPRRVRQVLRSAGQ